MFARSSAMLLFGAFCVAASGATHAAPHFPSKPITLVVGFAPGGGIDLNARLLAKGLERRFGQPVIVENRPGAGSKIANARVARAAADGYTLLVTTAAVAIDMAFSANAGVDAQRDFAPVSTISTTPMILVVNPSLPVESVHELIAYARARPGALNYSSSGIGTTLHLYGELFKLRTGTDIVHVPFKGTAPSLNALLAGEVPMTFATLPSVIQFVQERRLRALATTGSGRSERLPDVPTMKEAGVADAEAEVWYGVLAPAATPPDVIETLANAIDGVSRSSEFVQRMRALGVEPDARTPEAFRQLVHEEVARWAEIAKSAHIDPD
jgi:tripartite-type tricarboxylate transporter receptor subunit TctC